MLLSWIWRKGSNLQSTSLYHFFSRSCIAKIKTISPSTSPEDFGPLVECIVSWGRGADILELACDWLTTTFQAAKHDNTIEDEVSEMTHSLFVRHGI